MHKLFVPTVLALGFSTSVLAQPIPLAPTFADIEPTQDLTQAPTTSFDDFFAQEEKPENLHEQGFELSIRVLERFNDTTDDFTISPQNSVIYRNTLLIRAESCVTDFNNIPGNDGGFITVENRDGDMLYKGWIFKSMPSLTVFEHPDYDILVRSCVVG